MGQNRTYVLVLKCNGTFWNCYLRTAALSSKCYFYVDVFHNWADLFNTCVVFQVLWFYHFFLFLSIAKTCIQPSGQFRPFHGWEGCRIIHLSSEIVNDDGEKVLHISSSSFSSDLPSATFSYFLCSDCCPNPNCSYWKLPWEHPWKLLNIKSGWIPFVSRKVCLFGRLVTSFRDISKSKHFKWRITFYGNRTITTTDSVYLSMSLAKALSPIPLNGSFQAKLSLRVWRAIISHHYEPIEGPFQLVLSTIFQHHGWPFRRDSLYKHDQSWRRFSIAGFARKNDIELILMDERLPELTTILVFLFIEKTSRWEATPIVSYNSCWLCRIIDKSHVCVPVYEWEPWVLFNILLLLSMVPCKT